MAKKRGGLGRGLESLFEDVSPSFESDNKVETLPLREIEPDPGQPRKTFDLLARLWDAAHLTIRDIRQHTGLSQAAFATRYCIPTRTLEDWERGVRSCPDYLRLLLAQASGLYTRP